MPPAKSPTTLLALGAISLGAMILIAYAPALQAGYIWDDDFYVTNNATLRSAAGLGRIWFELGATPQYYPLVFTTFWAEYQLWALNPVGYHLVNVLLHALSAVLLWRILTVLRVPGGWIAAAVFALHPVQVESVAWITERKNVLSGAFYLGSALAYLYYDAEGSPDRPGRRRLYAVSLVLFCCALLSKTVTASLPAALLLVVWWKRGRVTRIDLKALLPFFASGLALGLVTVWMERSHVGATGAEWDLTLIERVLIAGRAVWFYAAKLVWPHPLIFIYPYWLIDAGAWWQHLFPAAAVAAVVSLWAVRHRTGRGPLVAVLFFVGTLVPALGFFNVFPMRYSFVADHFQYLASIGLIALIVAACVTAGTRLGAKRDRVVAAAAACVLLVLGSLTWRQGHIYEDQETLWLDTLRKNPNAWMAHINLASLRFAKGRLDEALGHYVGALVGHPLQSDPRVTRGAELLEQNRPAEAVESLRQAAVDRPFCQEALDGIGVILASEGHTENALDFFTASVIAAPDYYSGYYNRGRALLRLQRYEEAVTSLREAIRHNPRFVESYRQLATALAMTGKHAEAWEQLRTYESLGGTPPPNLVRELRLRLQGSP